MERFYLSHKRILLPLLLLALFHFGVSETRGQEKKPYGKVVSFQTEDGLTLYASLRLPEKLPSTPIPGVVLLSEPMRHDRVSVESGTGEGALDLVKRGIAVLNLDPRGNVMNRDPKHFRFFSPQDMEKIQLDVRAAVQFLAAQKDVDPGRIGVVAIGMVGTYAVLAAENPAIRAVVL